MAQQPKGFTFFETYYEALRGLNNTKYGTIMKALCEYAFHDVEPQFADTTLNAFWILIRPNVDCSIKRSLAGKKGMQSRYNKTPNNPDNKTPNNPDNKAPNDKDKVKDKVEDKDKDKDEDKDKDKDKEEKKEHTHTQTRVDEFFSETEKEADAEFRPPTLDEVKAYCKAEGLTFNVERFINNYECKGWVVGKSPIRSWKAAARLWQSQEKQFSITDKPQQNVRNERPYISDAQRAKAARDAEFAAYAQRLLNTPDEKPELPF